MQGRCIDSSGYGGLFRHVSQSPKQPAGFPFICARSNLSIYGIFVEDDLHF